MINNFAPEKSGSPSRFFPCCRRACDPLSRCRRRTEERRRLLQTGSRFDSLQNLSESLLLKASIKGHNLDTANISTATVGIPGYKESRPVSSVESPGTSLVR
jgi:hypothetical protein